MSKQKINAWDLYLGECRLSYCEGNLARKKGNLEVIHAGYLGEESSLGDWVWYDTDYFVVVQYVDDEGSFGIIADCRDEQIANSILEAMKIRMKDVELPELPPDDHWLDGGFIGPRK